MRDKLAAVGEVVPNGELVRLRFVVTPKLADVDEYLKPSTRPYHQEWQLVHLFYIPRGAAVIPCGGTRYSNTTPPA